MERDRNGRGEVDGVVEWLTLEEKKNLESSAKTKNRRATGRSLFGFSGNKRFKQEYIDQHHINLIDI